jgi:hypothetical protein
MTKCWTFKPENRPTFSSLCLDVEHDGNSVTSNNRTNIIPQPLSFVSTYTVPDVVKPEVNTNVNTTNSTSQLVVNNRPTPTQPVSPNFGSLRPLPTRPLPKLPVPRVSAEAPNPFRPTGVKYF